MKQHPLIEKLTDRFKASDFLRNSLSLMSGTSIAHILPFAVSPIISRQYTRGDFDVLAGGEMIPPEGGTIPPVDLPTEPLISYDKGD